jgi:hypothetical protein
VDLDFVHQYNNLVGEKVNSSDDSESDHDSEEGDSTMMKANQAAMMKASFYIPDFRCICLLSICQLGLGH